MGYLSLSEIHTIKKEFEKEISIYDIKRYPINEFEEAVVLDDSLVLFIWIESIRALSIRPDYGKEYYSLYIEEVLYNELGFKHNHTKFIGKICRMLNKDYIDYTLSGIDSSCVIYKKFRGFKRVDWAPDDPSVPEYVDKKLPELQLRKRFELWEGVHYFFIVLEFSDVEGHIIRGCAYTMILPHQYILALGNKFIKTGKISGEIRISYNKFKNCMQTWKGTKRQKRLEEHMKYFVIEDNVREKDDVWRRADEILKQADSGRYDGVERSTYSRPIYKWVKEELVLKLTKKLYKQYNVISQHKPFFLISPFGGQMSYDIYIQELKVAIEYQGEQHFRPVDFFGGKESFEKQILRDKEKLRLSEEHGIKLVYINFDDDISTTLIKEKVEG